MLALMTSCALIYRVESKTRMLALVCVSWLSVLSLSQSVDGQVAFDVNASAGVRALNAPMAFAHTANTRLVSLELDVSTLFQPGAQQAVKEVMVHGCANGIQ